MVLAIVAAGAARAEDPELTRFFDEFTATWVRGNPNQAIAARYFSGAEQDELERQLTPETRAWRKARAGLAGAGLKQLATFDRVRMSETQRVSADLLRWQLERVVEDETYADYSFPLQQQSGANVTLINALTVVHPLATRRDAENYVARLGQLRPRLEEALGEARCLAEKRLIPPGFILRTTIEQMRQFASSPPERNPLVTVFAERMAGAKITSPGLREQAERIVAADVYPAWRAAIEFLQSLEPEATEDAGLWRFAGGAEFYAHQLRRFTSTALTAHEIHAIGLREVRRIEDEMDGLLRRLGRASGSVNERIAKLESDLRYPRDEEGRKALMADITTMLKEAEQRVPQLFDRLPKAPVIAQPYPRFREAAAAASYTGPTPDGSRPGIFQMPLRPDRMTKFGLRTLVYHETVPGHHLQIALELENDAQPRFRRIRAFGGIAAFAEGWALYAEHLAAESGWYEGDLEGRLGQLDAQLFRARRLVVDTGIHAERWTREQAIAYGISSSEVERYVVNPGQACAYMIGKLRILELREKAKKTLGARFALKDFHSAVLGTGTVPLDMLEREVDAYITSAGPRGATTGRSS